MWQSRGHPHPGNVGIPRENHIAQHHGQASRIMSRGFVERHLRFSFVERHGVTLPNHDHVIAGITDRRAMVFGQVQLR